MGLKYNERNISKWTGKVNDMGKAMKKNTKMSYEIGELDQYLFGQGTHYEIYKKLCAIRRSWVEVYHILNAKCRCPGGDPHGCCSGK